MKRIGLVLIMTVAVVLIFQSPVLAYKTFLCTGGVFEKNLNDYGDECVLYVRYEIGSGDTKKYRDVCNGEAWTCYQDAIDAGYAVGQTPKVGAIVVFGKSGMYSSAGHVGIVKDVDANEFIIRESNIVYHTVGERTIGNDDPNILGYIYCNGNGDDSTSTQMVMRVIGETGWYPANKTCINAEQWVRIKDGRASQSFQNNDICYAEYIRNPVAQDILIGTGDLPQECTQ